MDTFNETTGPFAPEYDTVRAEAQTGGESGETWFETDHATRGVSEWGQETFDENTYPEEEWEGDLEVNAPFASEDRSTELADARESAGPRPTLKRGSRGAEVQRAQTLLNDFLRRIASNPRECVDRSAARMAQMRDLLFSLRRNNQLPLVADGIFGPNTENATKLFQSCLGLVRDGIIGNVTWRYLEQSRSPRRSRRNPPNTAGCGLPEGLSGEVEAERDFELEMLGEDPRRVIPEVRPALSLFQIKPKKKGGEHFFHVANYIARRLKAYANPRAGRCTPPRVGPTAYKNGADIISAISAANACLKRPLSALHIVGHATPYGAMGATQDSGIYSEVSDPAHRARGARAIADIPINALANDIVVVLHGCNQGSGSDSFAELLYRHLAATLTSPVVFGHTDSDCAGRDESWRRFDSRSPDGRAVRSAAPHYRGNKELCKPRIKRESEEEAAWSTESEIVPSSEWGNEDTALESQWESSPEREPVWEETGLEAARRPCGCGQ